jgi:uncharacterized phiE125 gp8 family phage protein
MALGLITAPAVEPLTVLEVKKNLGIENLDVYDGITTVQAILPGAYAISTQTSSAIDVLGYIVTIALSIGTLAATATLDVTILESDDNVTYTTFQAFAQVTTTNDNGLFGIEYTGNKRYIKISAVIANAAASFSVDVQKQTGDTNNDIYIAALITAAREYCESYQNRAYITQTWELCLPDFPYNKIKIPLGKLQSITSIKYKDSTGTEKTLTNNTDYIYSTKGIIGIVVPAYGKTYPSFVPYPLDAVTIKFVCGYGDTAASVPAKIKQAMNLLISHWHENRLPLSAINNVSKELKFTITALLYQDRLPPI